MNPCQLYLSPCSTIKHSLYLDSPGVIEHFESRLSSKRRESIMHGTMRAQNYLMQAVFLTNLTLVKYFMHRITKQCLNVRDEEGETALFCLLKATEDNKVIACAQLLINAGIDMNARKANVQIADEIDLDEELDPTAFQGDSVLGACVRFLIQSQDQKTKYKLFTTPREQKKVRKLAEYFIENGALCFLKNFGQVDWRVNSEEVKDKRIKKSACAALLQNIEIEVNWTKFRWLYIAVKDQNSSLYGIPEDVLNVIFTIGILVFPFSPKH